MLDDLASITTSRQKEPLASYAGGWPRQGQHSMADQRPRLRVPAARLPPSSSPPRHRAAARHDLLILSNGRSEAAQQLLPPLISASLRAKSIQFGQFRGQTWWPSGLTGAEDGMLHVRARNSEFRSSVTWEWMLSPRGPPEEGRQQGFFPNNSFLRALWTLPSIGETGSPCTGRPGPFGLDFRFCTPLCAHPFMSVSGTNFASYPRGTHGVGSEP